MLWTMVFTYPLQGVFQSVCARIGRVTGKGLASNIKSVFPPWVLLSVVALVLFANILNVSSDVAAMGEAAALYLPGQGHLLTVGFALLTLGLLIFVPYHLYVWILKWLTLSLFAYVAVAFIVKAPWGEVLIRTVWPQFKVDKDSLTMIVAIFGTTISPYLFFWQASEEVEEIETHADQHALKGAPGEAREELRRIGWDTYIGMGYLQPHRLLRHPRHRRHPQRPRRYQHPDRLPGRRRVEADRRRLRLRPVRAGHRRNWTARHSDAGGLGRLRP